MNNLVSRARVASAIIVLIFAATILAACSKSANQAASTASTPPPLAGPQVGQEPGEILEGLDAEEKAKTVLNAYAFFLLAFRCHTGRFPTEDEGLQALLAPPTALQESTSWRGPYCTEEFLSDPWGRLYQYQWLDAPEILYEIRSLGPDGVESADDLRLSEIQASAQFARRSEVNDFVRRFEQTAEMEMLPDAQPVPRPLTAK